MSHTAARTAELELSYPGGRPEAWWDYADGLLDDDEIARLAAKAEEPYHAPDGIHRPRRRFDAVLDGLSERERTAKDE